MRVVCSLSGGLDSTTLLFHLLNQGFEITAIFFEYGSKHNPYEKEAVYKIKEYCEKKTNYSFELIVINISNLFPLTDSTLLLNGGDIPEGHFEDPIMKQTILPGRNLIFLSIMASFAESIGAQKIAIGVQSGDYAIYPDCTPIFIEWVRKTIKISTSGTVDVYAPFLYFSKYDIIIYGIKKDVPFELTRTCYKNQPIACGKCGSCVERIEAFNKLNLKDPIIYEY